MLFLETNVNFVEQFGTPNNHAYFHVKLIDILHHSSFVFWIFLSPFMSPLDLTLIASIIMGIMGFLILLL